MNDESGDSGSSGLDTRIPYFRLLNSLANDLDYMLNDLYTTPPSTLRMSGDAFLEPYMQGLSNDVNHASNINEVFDGSSNVFKKRLQNDCPGNEDRMSTLSSPVNSLDTPLDERTENNFRLIEVNAGSQGSLNQLISGDECSDASSENSSLIGDEETTCDITLVERLIRSHPIWFLPGIQRAGAFHLLQGKEDGNFVVRQSSHNSTMAISVRLPSGKGPYIEHYLIQGSGDGQIGLESSDNKFTSIPLLIAHYCQCCDELPVQLTLPRAIREAKNRQQLTSLALLGQEFWRYPMANSRQSFKLEDESPSSLPRTISIRESNPLPQNTSFLSCSGSSSSSNSPASSLSSFENSSNNRNSSCSALEQTSFGFDVDSNTPSEETASQTNNLMTTFKGCTSFSSVPYNQIGIPVVSESPLSLPVETSQSQPITTRRSRPTPPNTLNLISTTSSAIIKNSDGHSENGNSSRIQFITPGSKTAPPPPPRWTKPPLSCTYNNAQNFTVTTTLTLSVNKDASLSADTPVNSFQVSESVQRVEKHTTNSQVLHTSTSTTSLPTIPPTPLPRSYVPQMITSPTSPSQSSQVLSPVSEGNTRPFHRRNRRPNKSTHYQASVISSYNRSRVIDKISDYEDIWGPENSLVTFKPQPPPRTLPFPSLDDCSFKNNSKRTPSPSPASEVEEKPSVTPSAPSAESNCNPVTENKIEAANNSTNMDVPSPILSPTISVPTPQIPVTLYSKSDHDDVTSTECTFGSPFYAEPADAIKQEALKRRMKPMVSGLQSGTHNRRSDPTSLHPWSSAVTGGGDLERIDSKEELITSGTFSSSLDNLARMRNSREKSNNISPPTKNVKPVDPPKLKLRKSICRNAAWAVDSSWEFIAKETGEDEDSKSDIYKNTYDDHKLVTQEHEKVYSEDFSSTNVMTFQEMIFERIPELRLSPVFNKTNPDLENKIDKEITDKKPLFEPCDSIIVNDTNNNSNTSDKIYHNGLSVLSQISDTSDDTQTEFSEPWDSTQWEHLFVSNDKFELEESSAQISRCKSFKERLDPLLSPPRLLALAKTRAASSTPGATIRAYAFKLAADKETVFAKAIDNFIACTIDSKETKPQVVMRNMRQFMSGMKNYLVTHGEREFINEVESERSKLRSTEFLNLDAILEGVMHKLVVTPLKSHLCRLFVSEYEENGAVQVLVENIRYARTKAPCDLGIREKLILPSYSDLEKIAYHFRKLQIADSPLDKLEYLLSAIATIFHSVKEMNSKPESVFLSADDFLPIFVWVLVQTGMVAAEVEAEYMWGLLHPSLLSGEGGYYLTTLSSAVNVLKNFCQHNNNELLQPVPWYFDPLAEFKCVLKVVVPNEMNGSLLTKTLPVRPNMTTKDVCKIIALKSRITNPQDYALFKLVDGEETMLNETECPQDVKSELAKSGKHCMFAYKRIDAKIAWPRSATTSQPKLRN